MTTTETKNLKLTFVRAKKDGAIIGCIAYYFDGPELYWEYSVHNSHDEYSRTRSRDIAIGRLDAHPRTLHVGERGSNKISAINRLMLHIIDGIFPTKLQRGALNYLFYAEKKKAENYLTKKVVIPRAVEQHADDVLGPPDFQSIEGNIVVDINGRQWKVNLSPYIQKPKKAERNARA